MALSVLFVGGTGQISLPCVERAVAAGHRVTLLNRGRTAAPLPAEVEQVEGAFEDDGVYQAIADRRFDAVCQFIVFRPDQMRRDVDTFAGRCGQYVFVSTASAYRKPMAHHLLTERVPLDNPYWAYSRLKAEAETVLSAQSALPWTIVRPSHTLRTKLPAPVGDGDHMARRLLAGRPVIVPGDGNNLWTITRSRDFAVPFVNLLGNERAIGEAFHITGNAAFSWDQIVTGVAAGLGVEADIVHVPTDTLVRHNRDWEGPLRGDKAWSVLFDNSKVRAVAGDFSGAGGLATILAEPLEAFRARRHLVPGDEAAQDALFDRLAAAQRAL